MIVINDLKEAEEFLSNTNKIDIKFQNKKFYSVERFKEFIDDLKSGIVLQMPKNTINHTFYCNFGTIYCDTLVITETRLIFFNSGKLIFIKTRDKHDDIEMAYSESENRHCSCNPLVYDDEQDYQFDNYTSYPVHHPTVVGSL